MWKLVLLAHLPVWAVLFGAATVAELSFFHLSEHGVPVLYGTAIVSFLLSFPIAWWIARRRMLTRRERGLIDHLGDHAE